MSLGSFKYVIKFDSLSIKLKKIKALWAFNDKCTRPFKTGMFLSLLNTLTRLPDPIVSSLIDAVSAHNFHVRMTYRLMLTFIVH